MRRFSLSLLLAFVLCMLASIGSPMMAAPASPQSSQYLVYAPLIRNGAAQAPARPRIASFSANPASITAGGSTTLRWSVSAATSLRITPAIGAVSSTSVSARPAATTTADRR